MSAVEKANAKRAIAAHVKVAPLAALQTGTLNAADLMGWSDKVGALEAGKWADIIAVAGDPLHDVTLLQHVAFVMKAGVVYKREVP